MRADAAPVRLERHAQIFGDLYALSVHDDVHADRYGRPVALD
jgi:hypothetical protein